MLLNKHIKNSIEINLKSHFLKRNIEIIKKHEKTLNLINHPGNVTFSHDDATTHPLEWLKWKDWQDQVSIKI